MVKIANSKKINIHTLKILQVRKKLPIRSCKMKNEPKIEKRACKLKKISKIEKGKLKLSAKEITAIRRAQVLKG